MFCEIINVNIEYSGYESRAVLTGVMSRSGVTDSSVKCISRQDVLENGTNINSNTKANYRPVSTRITQHLEWITEIAMSGSCNKGHGKCN